MIKMDPGLVLIPRSTTPQKPVSCLTCWTSTTEEGAWSVKALYWGISGAGLVGEATLIHVSCAGRATRRRHPASVTDALIFGLLREKIKQNSKSKVDIRDHFKKNC